MSGSLLIFWRCLPQLGEHLRQLGVPVPGGELQLPLALPPGLPPGALPPGLLPAAFLQPGATGAATPPPALPPLPGASASAASPQQKKGPQGPPIDVRRP